MRRAIAGIPQERPQLWDGRAQGRKPVSPVVATAMGALSVYKRFVSPLLPAACRFQPTCSEYSYGALSRYGLLKGSMLTVKRLLRCHPFHPGGFDPP